MSFQQGLSGLDAASQSLDVIGNNIANANSAGFKSSTAEFSDVFASSIGGGGGSSVGIGTQLATVAQQFTQGDITTTNNPMDLAINGNGFFRMSDNGAISYTRDGEFQVDSNGFITNSTGEQLTGYPANATGTIVPAAPVPLQLSNSNLPPKATTSTDANLNLDATMSQPATAVFNPTDPTSYNSSTSISVYDSLGNAHTVSLYYVKTATTNQWNLQANVDGTAIGNVDLGAGAGAAEPIAFDNAGNLTTTMPINVSVDLAAVATANGGVNGAITPMTFTLDMTGTTQFGSGFAVNNLTQDGFTSGRLTSTSIGADGVIQGRYTNGQSLVLGQVVMANFNSPSGLKPLGQGQWAETTASGQPLVGVPGSGSNGAIQAGAIESSNVDLTAQLVEMITEQRAYQANAQSIKTQDAVLQTLVTLD
jgi:flagellar hook protein FlgE